MPSLYSAFVETKQLVMTHTLISHNRPSASMKVTRMLVMNMIYPPFVQLESKLEKVRATFDLHRCNFPRVVIAVEQVNSSEPHSANPYLHYPS